MTNSNIDPVDDGKASPALVLAVLRAQTTLEQDLSRWQFVAICLLIALLSLTLNVETSTIVLAGIYDNERYLDMAQAIVDGQWLGPYNYLTLIRLPLYPLFLAVNALLDTRLPLFQHLALLVSFLVLCVALRHNGLSRGRTLLTLILCSFNPVTLFLPRAVLTETLAVIVLTLVFAACLGLFAGFKRGPRHFVPWLLLFGLGLGCYINIRSEGLWALGLFAILLIAIALRWRRGALNLRMVILCLLPLVSSSLISDAIGTMNARSYGHFNRSDLTDENFTAAMNILTRIEPQSHRRQVPITAAAFEAAYGASPHMAMLKESLDSQFAGGPWLQLGCDAMGECEEISGGWTVWAVRDAAGLAGKHDSASTASAFYGAIAGELSEACEAGTLNCGSNGTGSALAPPLQVSHIPAVISSTMNWSWNFLLLDGFRAAIEAVLNLPVSEELVARYHSISNDQYTDETNSQSPLYPSYISGFVAFQLFLLTAVTLGWIAQWRRLTRMNLRSLNDCVDFSAQQWIGLLALAAMLGRLLVVGYIDAMSFFAQIRYTLVVYPMLMVFIVFYLPNPFSLKKNEVQPG